MAALELPGYGAGTLGRFVRARESLYRRRHEEFALGLSLSFGFALLTGLAAQVAFRTPFSPVPITLQVLAVLVSGTLLGYRWGTVSQVLYVLLGAVLVPWYAPAAGQGAFSTGGLSTGSLGGLAQLSGGLGGYLVAFPVAAFLVGFLSDRYVQARSPLSQVAVMEVAVGVIYALGAAGLWIAFRWPFSVVVAQGILLFVPVDLAKAVVAGGIGTALTPKGRFGPESPRAAKYRRWWPLAR